MGLMSSFLLFFFNDPATTEIYTLSLHDALPICFLHDVAQLRPGRVVPDDRGVNYPDRKSTRLNSSHLGISYAVFCLKKKNTISATTDRSTSRVSPTMTSLATIPGRLRRPRPAST